MKKERLVLYIAIFASLIAFLDGSIVNVALPAIASDLGGDFGTQQWVVDAYLITLGALMLIAGSLSDIFGRQRTMIAGLLGFGGASILCALAPSSTFLITARALQGVAGALLVPSSLALIMSVFPKERQGKAIGTWTAWTGIAMIVGPLVGGVLVDVGSWRYVFLINLLPIVITLLLLSKLRHAEQPPHRGHLDILGALLCAVGLGATVYALIEQSRFGWNSPIIYGSMAVGVLALGTFLFWEHHIKEPMLPLHLFRKRNFIFGNLATVMIYAALTLATFLITIFVQQVGGYGATQAGLTLIPVTLIMFLLSARFGSLSGKIGARWFMTSGPVVAGIGFLSMLLVESSFNYWNLLPGILLFGLGLSITVSPLTATVLGAIKREHSGIASAVNNAIARVAGLIAIAGISPIIGDELGISGFHNGMIFIAILLFLGGGISAIGIRKEKM